MLLLLQCFLLYIKVYFVYIYIKLDAITLIDIIH